MNKYIKENCNVNTDSMTWVPLKTSAFYKDEFRINAAEIELIDSYTYCMAALCNQIKSELIPYVQVLKTYSLCIPYLFVCRHTIELILKKAIEENNIKAKNVHTISNLWNICKKEITKKELSYYDELVDTIDMLDDSGQRFRYVKDTKGNEFENKPIFVNVEEIKNDIIKLKNELLQGG